jgi:hypothetical protein
MCSLNNRLQTVSTPNLRPKYSRNTSAYTWIDATFIPYQSEPEFHTDTCNDENLFFCYVITVSRSAGAEAI